MISRNRLHAIFIVFSATLLLNSLEAWSGGPRTALIIGNSDYITAPLKNPVNDARSMANVLRSLGFTLIYGENSDRREMRKLIRDLEERLGRKKGVGLFYFAGHGVQVDGVNYLIPVGADIQREYEVADQAIRADLVIQAMAYAGNKLNIIILDACRNNPFPKTFRSSTRGLARMDINETGMLIAYATSPGSVAYDGVGENGIYTRHLLSAMQTPGLSLEQVFKRVRHNVIKETARAQTPWEESSLTGDFYFFSTEHGDIVINNAKKMHDSKELTLWKGISESSMIADYQLYLKNYPKGVFAPLAKKRIESLKSTNDKTSKQATKAVSQTAVSSQPIIGRWKFDYTENRKKNYLQFIFLPDGTGNSEGEEPDGSWWAEPISWHVTDTLLTITYKHGSVDKLRIEDISPDTLTLLGLEGNNVDERFQFMRFPPEHVRIKLTDNDPGLFGKWRESWEEDGHTAYQIITLEGNRSARQEGWKPAESWSDSGTWRIDPPDILVFTGDGYIQKFKIIHVTRDYLDMLDLSPGYEGIGSRYMKIQTK